MECKVEKSQLRVVDDKLKTVPYRLAFNFMIILLIGFILHK